MERRQLQDASAAPLSLAAPMLGASTSPHAQLDMLQQEFAASRSDSEGVSLSLRLGVAQGPQEAAASQHQDELGWLASSDHMLLVSYGSQIQQRSIRLETLDWGEGCLHSHDPIHSGEEPWVPSSRPSSEGMLLDCRSGSHDPSSTPQRTPSSQSPMWFTLPPMASSPPSLPVSLPEDCSPCSPCSAAGISRSSSHASQRSLLSLTASAGAQDAIMSFDTLFSTMSTGQMLDHLSCQSALEEHTLDDDSLACCWSGDVPLPRAPGPTPSRPSSLQAPPEAPWLVNTEEMTVPPSLQVLKQLEQAARVLADPWKAPRPLPEGQAISELQALSFVADSVGTSFDLFRSVMSELGPKSKGKEATSSSSRNLLPHARQRRRADSADAVCLAIERRLLSYLSSQETRRRSALGTAGGSCGGGACSGCGPTDVPQGTAEVHKCKSVSSPLPAKPHSRGGLPITNPLLFCQQPSAPLPAPAPAPTPALASPGFPVLRAAAAGVRRVTHAYHQAQTMRVSAPAKGSSSYPGFDPAPRPTARSAHPSFPQLPPGPGMQSWSALASAYAAHYAKDKRCRAANPGQGSSKGSAVTQAKSNSAAAPDIASPIPQDPAPSPSCGQPIFSTYSDALSHLRGLNLSHLKQQGQAEVKEGPALGLLQRLGCFAAPQVLSPELREEQIWLASLARVAFDASVPSHRSLLAALCAAVPRDIGAGAAVSGDDSCRSRPAPCDGMSSARFSTSDSTPAQRMPAGPVQGGTSASGGAGGTAVGAEGGDAVEAGMSCCFKRLGLPGAGADPAAALHGCGLLGLLQLYLVLKSDKDAAEALWQQLGQGQGGQGGGLTPAALSLMVTRWSLQLLHEGRLSGEAQRLQSYCCALERLYLGAMYTYLDLCRSSKASVSADQLLRHLQVNFHDRPRKLIKRGYDTPLRA